MTQTAPETEAQAANSPPETELDRLRRELEMLTKGGIVEVAVRNPNVFEYMKHWEGRLETAEAQVTTLTEPPDELLHIMGRARWGPDYSREKADMAHERRLLKVIADFTRTHTERKGQ